MSIPTASMKLMDLKTYFTEKDIGSGYAKWEDIPKIMVEFAKLHVEAALKAASEGLQASQNGDYNNKLKSSILTAYPPENIK